MHVPHWDYEEPYKYLVSKSANYSCRMETDDVQRAKQSMPCERLALASHSSTEDTNRAGHLSVVPRRLTYAYQPLIRPKAYRPSVNAGAVGNSSRGRVVSN